VLVGPAGIRARARRLGVHVRNVEQTVALLAPPHAP